MAAKTAKEFVENELRFILKAPLSKDENDVLVAMINIVWEAATKAVEEKLTAHNTARDKICADIVKSNIICDYCAAKTGAGCYRICKKPYSGFVGRKLRPC